MIRNDKLPKSKIKKNVSTICTLINQSDICDSNYCVKQEPPPASNITSSNLSTLKFHTFLPFTSYISRARHKKWAQLELHEELQRHWNTVTIATLKLGFLLLFSRVTVTGMILRNHHPRKQHDNFILHLTCFVIVFVRTTFRCQLSLS